MKQATKILIVEHDQCDIDLVQHELKKGKINYVAQIVETEEAFKDALLSFEPDIILSDYSLPAFSGTKAFKLKEEMAPDTPFIFVSGSIGEENSIELIKKGATDFALKDKLVMLPLKVIRALKEATGIKEKRKIEEAIRTSEQRYHSLFDNIFEGFALCQMIYKDGRADDYIYLEVNDAFGKLTGLHNVIGKKLSEIIPELKTHNIELLETYGRVALTGKPEKLEIYAQSLEIWVDLSVYSTAQGFFTVLFDDITVRKSAELQIEELNNKLLANNQELSSILNTMPANVALLDEKGTIVAVDDSWIQFAEDNHMHSTTHGLGDNYIEICNKATGSDKEIATKMAEGLKGILDGSLRELQLEYPNDSPTEKRWYRAEVRPLIEKKHSGAVVMHLNITDRKEAELRVLQSEQYHRSLIENISDAIVLINEKFETIYMSESSSRMTGFTIEETRSRPGFDFVHPNDRKDCETLSQQAYASPGVALHIQYRILHKNGHYIWIEGTIINLLQNENIKAFVVNYRDITQRVEYEQTLKQIGREISDYKFAMDESSIVSFTDTKGTIKYANDNFCKISGYTREELIGQDHRLLKSNFHSKDFFKDLWKTISSGKVWRGEVKNKRKDGQFYWVDATIVPFLDECQKPFQYMGIRNDITERKVAENALQELNKNLELRVVERTAELTEANIALESFSYSVSHDLRAPVRSITAFTKIIQKDYGPGMEPDLLEMFELIQSSGKRMDAIIVDLLSLAKYGKATLRPGHLNMKELFAEVWRESNQASKAQIEFELSDLPTVIADGSMMRQVVVNLLSNAIKYSSKKEKPSVKVGFEEKEGEVIFSVADNGAGFNMKNYDRLFGAFQRLHGMSEFEGTGVGLMIVKSIIDKHHGKVWAEGLENEGATFYFSLPV